MKRKIQTIILICINIALISLIIYYPFYIEKAAADKSIGFCFVKNFLGLYCITCGGTRAFGDVLSLDIISAIKYNALVVSGFIYIIFLDIYALYALIKKKESLIYFKPAFCLYIILITLAFVIIRNIFVYAFGIDTIGDLIS